MKILAALIFMLTILISGTAAASPIPLRGVVEGFYGTPWTFENRADLMKFCRTHNLNAYIYAPKDDPYHREKWREPYPAAKLDELKKLVELADANGVRFIFAISPGLDLHYSGSKGDEDFKALIRKISAVYDIGVRNFAIFFDDLKDDKGVHHEDGRQHAEFLNKVQLELRKFRYVMPLITVPTEYYRLDMIKSNGKVSAYTEDFAKALNKKIVVLYTGDGVVCDGIAAEDFEAACQIYGRDLGIWWNYPVNDYATAATGDRNSKLALGAIEKLPTKNVQAIFFNPMAQYELSKVALITGAEYANSPDLYDAEISWDKALAEQFGDLADAMKVFATHSRHMENSWAKVGAADAPEFEALAYIAVRSVRVGHTPDFERLNELVDEMDAAADSLLKNLPEKFLAECKPQLEQFRRIIQGDRLAIKSLQQRRLDPNLKTLRDEISMNEKTAVLSEKAALKLIDDTIDLLNR